jgi:NAD(P)-dependent dehydrogenase (short-subunit alcohol dehydrogenase family)
MFLRCDVRDTAATERCMEQAFDEFGGRLDIVINNAGIADEGDVDKILAVNLRSVITGTESALRLITRNSKTKCSGTYACILNVASAAGILPLPSSPVYSATKSGVVGYSVSRASSAWRRNVRINALCPGPARTPLTAGYDERLREMGVGMMEAETVADALLQIINSSNMHGEALYISERTGVVFPLRVLTGELKKAIGRRAAENGEYNDQLHARL